MKTKPAIISVTAFLVCIWITNFTSTAKCDAAEITTLNPPVLHWAFDETGGTSAIDSTGNGNTGTLYNIPTRVTGQFDYALQFDGINDYVHLNDLSTTISGDMSISCWLNYTNANTAKRAIDLADFQVRFNDGKVGWDNGGGPAHETFSTAAYNDGQWHHVVFVRTGTSYQMYIDTVPDNSDTGTTPTYDWIYVGKRASGDLYTGIVDDVQIFDYALSADDIDNLFYGTGGTVNVKFESGYSSGLETVTLAELTVVVNNAVPEHVYTVDYDITGGTATGGGEDYTLVGNTLTFLPGDTSEIISIPIVDDSTPEPDETIIVTLSNPTGIDLVLGSITSHTYTITDSTPRISFNSASSSGPENTVAVSIPVSLSAASNDTITVDYDVTGGTATGGAVDYTLSSGTLTFNPQVITEYISIAVIDDGDAENAEIIEITLSNPVNAQLGSITQHNYVINDDDLQNGLMWDDLIWYYSGNLSDFFVNGDGDLQWSPEGGEQFITRIPDQRLSQVGDVVKISYMWLTDGRHDCPDCFSCDLFCHDNDITCIAGTSDMRVALCEADGEYVQDNGFDVTGSSIFNGYKGYNFRFGPNMTATDPDGLTRWVDCHDEVHKTGMFAKKPVSNSDLMFLNDGLKDRIPGFELPPGEWSKLTLSLERTSTTEVLMSITLNDRTYTYIDDEPDQPSKIDVIAVHMRNHRPYNKLILSVLDPPPTADFTGDCIVDACDLEVLSQDWLDSDKLITASQPDDSNLVLDYSFDSTLNNFVPTGLTDDTGTYTAQIIVGTNPASEIKYASPNPTTGYGTSAQFINDIFDTDAADTFVIPDSGGLDFNDFDEFSIELFVNPSSSGSGNTRRLFSESIYLYMYLNADNTLNAIRKWGGGSWVDNRTLLQEPNFPLDIWSHVAMTWDADSENDRFKLYINGELVASARGNSDLTLGAATGFAIGGYQRDSLRTAQPFCGSIDQFSIYDYALSHEEILYLANDGPATLFVPLDSPTNLYDDGIIDGKDFAEFATEWLVECQ